MMLFVKNIIRNIILFGNLKYDEVGRIFYPMGVK